MKTKKTWYFYYTLLTSKEKPILVSQQDCISPARTKQYKNLMKMLGQDGIYKVGYTCDYRDIDIYDNKNETEIVHEVRQKAIQNYKDSGTCVLGMELRYNGRLISDQIWQGNMPNYSYFRDLKAALVKSLQYDESKFSIEHGRMD